MASLSEGTEADEGLSPMQMDDPKQDRSRTERDSRSRQEMDMQGPVNNLVSS